jgi:hypothetical protein
MQSIGKGLAGRLLHNQAEQDVAGVGVAHSLAGGEVGRMVGAVRIGEEFFGRPDPRPIGALAQIGVLPKGAIFGEVVVDAAGVREQLAQRHLLDIGNAPNRWVIEPVRDRIVQGENAFVDQLQDKDRGEGLGDAVDAKPVGRRQGGLFLVVREPGGSFEENLPVLIHRKGDAR